MINAGILQQADAGTVLEVFPPVLFNTFKHHAGALRARIATVVRLGSPALADLGARLSLVGTRLMDLYVGELTPRDLSAWVVSQLRAIDRLPLESYRSWLLAGEEYTLFTHQADGSRWVLRLGDEKDRYIHLHPGRASPQTVRVRANILKTAFLVLCRAGIELSDPQDSSRINAVRREYLGLSPIGDDPGEASALRSLIDLLAQ
ncbi:MAG: hypothetical protein U0840_25125 [Gemmataceae bacterium]